MDKPSPVLRLDDIRFRYRPGASWAVDGVSLQVDRGEIVGLLGPNGAGKSTVMTLVAGLRRPDSGRIERAPEVLARGGFALVPQDHAFYPMLTCRENLAFFAGVLGLGGERARERVRTAAATTGLDRVLDQRASECSGGLKRRLNLAIGLIGDPVLLLLDEPTVGVDPQSRAFLLDAVRALRAEGRAIIYTSHYMDEVQAISDRVAVIDHGRLLCCGTLGELLSPGETSLEVRVDRPLPAGARGRLARSWGLQSADGHDGQTLVFNLPADGAVEDVLRELRRVGLAVSSIQYGCRHLEDLFLRLTHRSLRD